MMLNTSAAEFEHIEREEVLSYLPPIAKLRVVELAAGIGRFTGYLASQAEHIPAVDFVEEFVAQNKKINGHRENITFVHGDASEVEAPADSIDFVFINWLMMYLEDPQVVELIDHIHRWLKPGGRFFFRESCISSSNPNAKHPHSHYRQPEEYLAQLQGRFSILSHGNIKIYQTKYNNPNQLWWLCQKHG